MDLVALREVAQAGKDKDPAWYRIHRRLSFRVTRVALRTGATADDASYAMIAAGLVGSLFVAGQHPVAIVLGFALLYAGFLLDKVDGELARIFHAESARGVMLDRLYHRLIEPLLFVAVAVHEFRLTGAPGILAAGFVTALAANAIEENQQLAPFILWKRLREGGSLPRGKAPSRSRRLASLTSSLRPLKGFRMLIVALPLFAAAYAAEALWGIAFPALALFLSAISLVVFLVAQSLTYLGGQMDAEIHAITQVLRGLDLSRHEPVGVQVWKEGWSSRPPQPHPQVTPPVPHRKRRRRARKHGPARATVSRQQGDSSCVSMSSGRRP